MPARQFFLMLDAARRLVNYEAMIQSDIAAIAICDAKYHQYLKQHYQDGFRRPAQMMAPPPVSREGASGIPGHMAMQSLFMTQKRNMYGR